MTEIDETPEAEFICEQGEAILLHAHAWVCHTSGAGRYSNVARAVRITGAEYGSDWLVLFFDPADWDRSELGLIYTDPQFLAEVAGHVASIGVTAKLHYSEQGAQGDCFVDFDCDWLSISG